MRHPCMILILGLLLGSLAPVAIAEEPEEPTFAYPYVVALLLHEDGDPASTRLAHHLDALEDELIGKGVVAVTLDRTDATARRGSDMLGALMGMEFVVKQHAGRTGVLLVVEPSRLYVSEVLTGDADRDTIRSVMVGAAKQAKEHLFPPEDGE